MATNLDTVFSGIRNRRFQDETGIEDATLNLALGEGVQDAAEIGASFLIGVGNSDPVRSIIGLLGHSAGLASFEPGSKAARTMLKELDLLAEYATVEPEMSNVAYQLGKWGTNIPFYLSVFRSGTWAASKGLQALAPAGSKIAVRASADAAAKTVLPRVTALERLIPAVGGATASGAVEAGRITAEAENPNLKEALYGGGKVAALVLGGELAMMGIGLGFARGRRAVNESKLMKRIEKRVLEPLEERLSAHTERLTAMKNQYDELMGVQQQEARLAAALKRASRPGPRRSVPGVQGFVSQKDAATRLASVQDGLRERSFALRSAKNAEREAQFLNDSWTLALKQDPNLGGFTTMNFLGSNLGLAKLGFIRLLTTAEGMAGKMGPVSKLALKLADDADIDSFLAKAVLGVKLADRMKRAARAMREAGFKAPRNPNANQGQFFNPVVEVYTTPGQGMQAVQARFGPKVASIMREFEVDYQDVEKLQRAGLKIKIPDHAELTAAGQANFFPQFLRDRAFRTRTVKGLKRYLKRTLDLDDDVAESQASRIMDPPDRHKGDHFTHSLEGLLSMEIPRLYGTPHHKMQMGLDLLDNPFAAHFKFMGGVEHTYAVARRFGPKNEVRQSLEKLAMEGGENSTLLANFMDNIVGTRWDRGLFSRFVQGVNDFEAAARLGYMAIPNLLQTPANNPLVFGLRESATGLFRTLRGQKLPKRYAHLGAAQQQKMMDYMMEHFAGIGGRETWHSRIADATLSTIQANRVEMFNRYSTMMTAQSFLTRKLAQSTAGRLRGRELDNARQVFADIGLDLGAGTSRVHAGLEAFDDGEWMRALFRAARRTQFTPTGAVKPIALSQSPAFRLPFLFNTFALNQGRLMRDYVFAEAARGNMAPASHFIAIHPLIGEVLNQFKENVRGKYQRLVTPFGPAVSRGIEDILMVGAFGMAQAGVYTAVALRTPDVKGLLGPGIRDMGRMGDALFHSVMMGSTLPLSHAIRKFPTVELAEKVTTTALGLSYLGYQELMELSAQDEAFLNSSPEGDLLEEEAAEAAPTLRDLQRQAE
jgi:hypothetical protein